MDKIELTIPDEIVKEITNPDKTFSHQLFTQKNDAEDKASPQRPLRSVILEKLNGNILKIFVSVGALQAAIENDVSSISSQTDVKPTESSFMQTDNKQTGKIRTQTDGTGTYHSSSQTEEKLYNSQGSQVQTKISDALTQTTIKTFAEKEQQCSADMADVQGQTQLSFFSYGETGCQADVAMNSVALQAEPDQKHQMIQARPTVKAFGVQICPSVAQVGVQEDVEQGEEGFQTDLSMMAYADSQCQSEYTGHDVEAQTESSFGLMEEAQTMTDAGDVGEVCVQTDYLGLSMETQTVPDTINRESQTTEYRPVEPPRASPHVDLSTEVEPLPEQLPDQYLDQTFPSSVEDEMPPSDNPLEISTQTEPVTIIIGDARFLIQKLKGVTASEQSPRGLGGGSRSYKVEVKQERDEPNGQSPLNYTPMRRRYQKPVELKEPPLRRGGNPKAPRFDCPLCPLCFLEVPPLYEHIQTVHGEEALHNYKKPKGREGKTTQMPYQPPNLMPVAEGSLTQELQEMYTAVDSEGNPVTITMATADIIKVAGSGELEPPVLEPAYEMGDLPPQLQQQPQEMVVSQDGQELEVLTASSHQVYVSQGQVAATPPLTQAPLASQYKNMSPTQTVTYPAAYPTPQLSGRSPIKIGSTPPRIVRLAPPGYVAGSGPVYRPPAVIQQSAESPGKRHQRTYSRPKAAAPEPALFEDLPEPNRAQQRNRVRRSEQQEEEEEEEAQKNLLEPAGVEYTCTFCDDRFGSPSYLYAHIQRAHKKELEAKAAERAATKTEPGAAKVKRSAAAKAVTASEEEQKPPELLAEEDDLGSSDLPDLGHTQEESTPQRNTRKRVAPASTPAEQDSDDAAEPLDDEDADEDFRPSAKKQKAAVGDAAGRRSSRTRKGKR